MFSVYNSSCGKHYVGMGIVPLREIRVQDKDDMGVQILVEPQDKSQQNDEAKTSKTGSKTVDAVSPGDSATPPSDSATGDATPSVNDTTPPGDSATPPSDDATHPGDDATPPVDSATPPVDSATHPGDDATPTRRQEDIEKNQEVALYVWQTNSKDKVFNELKMRQKTRKKTAGHFLKRYADNFDRFHFYTH